MRLGQLPHRVPDNVRPEHTTRPCLMKPAPRPITGTPMGSYPDFPRAPTRPGRRSSLTWRAHAVRRPTRWAQTLQVVPEVGLFLTSGHVDHMALQEDRRACRSTRIAPTLSTVWSGMTSHLELLVDPGRTRAEMGQVSHPRTDAMSLSHIEGLSKTRTNLRIRWT